MAKYAVVEKGDQRRTGSSRRDIGGAKVGDHRDACAVGDYRAFAELQRVLAMLVIERLAVAPDQRNAFRRDTIPAADYQEGAREPLADLEVQPRDFTGVSRRVGCGEDSVTHRSRVGNCAMRNGDDAASVDVDDRHVDRIDRGSADEPGYSHFP